MQIVDMFCGAGGESTGIHNACGELGLKHELFAINHWERAIETHAANYPDANHICEDVDRVDPLATVKSGKVALLWASPECTHHSVARGGRPRSNQSRAGAWQILKWCQELNIQRVIVENVPEFLSWGPLSDKGMPIQRAKGQIFRAWLNALVSLGYTVEYRILNAADYGDPTTRRRLFVQAVKGRKKILWPEPSHKETEDMYCPRRWRSAAEIIDWNIRGEPISQRARPLAENTMKRIEAGIRKFWGEYAEPFLISLRGTSKEQLPLTCRNVNLPVPTLSAGGGHVALIQPFLTAYHGGDPNRNYKVSDSIPTLDTSNRFGLVQPFIVQSEHDNRIHSVNEPMKTITTKSRGFGLVEPFILATGHSKSVRVSEVSKPLSTIVTKAEHCLIQPFILKYYGTGCPHPISETLDTVTTKERFALVEACRLEILFRMLQPHELSAAQGFPGHYKFAGNKTEIIKQIGNAVPCNTAKALCMSALMEEGAA